MNDNKTLIIPESEKKSWVDVAFIYAGAMICVSGMMIGGLLIAGLTFWQTLAATMIGYGIVIVYALLNGMQGSDLGLPSASVTAGALGTAGSRYIISLFLAISCIGWFGYQNNVCGSAFSIAIQSIIGIEIPPVVSSVVWGLIMLATAVWGFSGMKILNIISVPLLVIACIAALIISIKEQGFSAIIEYTPQTAMPFVSGVTMAVGGFALGGVLVFDYCRYAKTRKDVCKALIVGIYPVSVILIMIGAILSLLAGTYDIGAVFANIGLPVLGMLAVLLGTWTTNTTNAFSGGLAVAHMLNVGEDKRKIMTAISGLIGIVMAAVGLLDDLVGFLNVISAFIPPIAGVLIAYYWIICKGKKENFRTEEGFNAAGIASFAIGAAVAYYTGSINVFFIGPINGIVVSMVVYLVIYKLKSKGEKNA